MPISSPDTWNCATAPVPHLPGRGGARQYAFTALHDGDAIDLGRVRLTALETPGHTAESISLLAFDLDRAMTRRTLS